ncbi:unnamed protein product [Tilletia controversa]|uniref:Peptidase M43 pregnancy-associated plasma-A domain-containing protein n=3 Tax=Tilletia TaxID=13289 RepID=A0A8X7MUT4_9BASI|nr:hypothetical protein CF328_g4516 [Tilletia controversa]KAE8198810.1 hypothetical protein CF336_g1501 [Tilletia laevis]KAE8263129.1 hypothetical protein A4X03_0g1916 [Tilletia caries]KAE8204009.1 hypothetical protein CF335_g2808 [Tilletia laevis]KAE8248060.1 hypothetical protein A4X06_0g3988 [Tilletia controversa]
MQFKVLVAQAMAAMAMTMLAGAQTTTSDGEFTTTSDIIITEPTTTSTDDSTTTTTSTTTSMADPTDSITTSDSLMTPTATDSLNITSTTSTTGLPTETGFLNYTVAQGDFQDWPYGGDFVQPYAPEPVLDDAKLIELLYLANLNQQACERKANSYSQTSAFRKRTEEILSGNSTALQKRSNHKRSLLPTICLPAWETVDVTFHWLLNSKSVRSNFVLSSALDDQINDLAEHLARIQIAINVKGRWVWTGSDIDKVSTWDKTKAGQNAGILGSLKRKLGTDISDHLNIYLVDAVLRDDGASIEGICTFPLKNKVVQEHDGCIVAARTMRNYPNNRFGRPGAGMIHEVGHWFNLQHPHDGGCRGSDGMSDTKQYPVGEGDQFQQACLDTAGNLESVAEPVYNFMSYSSSANVNTGSFSEEQIAAAHTGLRVYRRGLQTAACQYGLRKRGTTAPFAARESSDEPISIDHLIRRQQNLTSICSNNKLQISNLEVSDWAVKGLNNPDSPPFTPPFSQTPADTSVVVPPKPQSQDSGTMGVIRAPNVKDFATYPGNNGIGSTGSSQDTVGTGTNGGKGTSGLGLQDTTGGTGSTSASVVKAGLPAAGVVAGLASVLASLLLF